MNFDEFENSALLKNSDQPSWKIFEQKVARWWLQNNQTLNVKRYWSWAEWSAKSDYQFEFQDTGIDGVAELDSGELWAIQVKFRNNPETPLKWREASTFFGLAARPHKRVFARRVLVTNTWAPGHTLDKFLQSNPDSLWLGRQAFIDTPVDWTDFAKHQQSKRTPKTPRPHQQEALDNITSFFESGGNRGQVHMACGSGKTLVALWVREKLKSQLTLVLVPTLSLARQLLLEWTANRNELFEFLTVCSDETVSHHDSLVEVSSTLGLATTTDHRVIAEFLRTNSNRPKIIFSTYQSSGEIEKAQKEKFVPAFDLVICDEAHKTAGGGKSSFTTILDDNRISAKRRLFMTATPRIYGERIKNRASEVDFQITSMDDDNIYGPIIHELYFAEAIDRGLLCDYQVVVISVTDAEVTRAIESRQLVNIDGHISDAELIATQIAIGKAIQKYNLNKIVTFHGRVDAAKNFSEASAKGSLPYILKSLNLMPNKGLWSAHISGAMPAGERSRLLHELACRQTVALVSNARCLTEGIDVPSLDGVAFIDPRQSKIDIVQAVGRAMRRSEGKNLGTIILPLIIRQGEAPEAALAGSRFSAIAEVLKALRAHDERLSATLDVLRKELGSQDNETSSKGQGFLTNHLIIDLPSHLLTEEMVKKIETQLVCLSTSNHLEMLGILKRFISEHGSEDFYRKASWEKFYSQAFVEGVSLKSWVNNRRQEYRTGTLQKWLKKELELLPGWSWDPFSDIYQQNLGLIKQYVNQYGWEKLNRKTIYKGVFLDSWLVRLRQEHKKGIIENWLKKELESIPGWSWNPFTDNKHKNLALLKQYMEQHGGQQCPQKAVFKGVKLGLWASKCRKDYKTGLLEDWLKNELESIPGWSWNPAVGQHQLNLTLLKSYIEQYGWEKLNRKTIYEGVHLDSWLVYFRQEHKKGRVEEWIKNGLESIPGWSWDPITDKHRQNLALLKNYIEQHGWKEFNNTTVFEGIKLGVWVGSNRQSYKKGRIQDLLKKELESIPGWSWDPFTDQRRQNLALLKTYIEQHGWKEFNNTTVFEGVGLGAWVGSNRQNYKKVRIEDWLKKELESLPGWSWDPLADQHRQNLALLKSYVEQYGWDKLGQKTVFDGMQLGTWITNRRVDYKKGKLQDWLKKDLDSMPGWSWDPITDQYRRNLALLKNYIKQYGWKKLEQKTVFEGLQLGSWITSRRGDYKKGKLQDWLKKELESIPGWKWSGWFRS